MAAAVEALGRGDLVVYPTDTLYALGADALDTDAVARVAEAKRRPPGQPISVAVADLPMLRQVARLPPRYTALAERLLPGPVTLVLPADPGVPDELLGSATGASPAVGPASGGATLGVRIPDHAWTRELCARFGPLTCTSANLHGMEAPATVAAARAQLGAHVAWYLDAGPLPGTASTLIDLTGPAPRVLREGALDATRLTTEWEEGTQPWRATTTDTSTRR